MSAAYYEDVDDIDDGDWVVRNGIRVWVEGPPAETAAPKTYDLTQLIACPSCHAKVTELCRSSGGFTRAPHTNRLAPRLCPCGALPIPRRTFCDDCRQRQDQESKNAHCRRLARGAA